MATPKVHVSSGEASSPLNDSPGSVSNGASPDGTVEPKSGGAGSNNWLNFALFSIGGVAAVGLVVILFGAYLMEPENTGAIVAGTIILMLAVIAWVFTALIMVGNLIWGMITSRGNESRKSPSQ